MVERFENSSRGAKHKNEDKTHYQKAAEPMQIPVDKKTKVPFN